MKWVLEALKEPFKRNKGDKNMSKDKKDKLEPPLPQPPRTDIVNPVVLSEEELKYVPEDDKMMYMELKEKNPKLAEQMLQGYKEKAAETEKKELPKHEITIEDILLDTHAQVLELRKDLNAFIRLYGR